jgi:hypothetical protein
MMNIQFSYSYSTNAKSKVITQEIYKPKILRLDALPEQAHLKVQHTLVAAPWEESLSEHPFPLASAQLSYLPFPASNQFGYLVQAVV